MGLDEIYHICVDQYVKMPSPRKCRWGHVPPLPPRRYATDSVKGKEVLITNLYLIV